jgi:hypothetical protein
MQDPEASNHFLCDNLGQVMGTSDACYCDCAGTGYDGVHCVDPLLCVNTLGGDLNEKDCGAGTISGNSDSGCVCDCANTGYEGLNCESPLQCIHTETGTEGHHINCQQGGEAVGDAQNGCGCDCAGTGYEGTTCETASVCVIGAALGINEIACDAGSPTGVTGSCGCDCGTLGYEGDLCDGPLQCVNSEGQAGNDINCQQDGEAVGDALDGCTCDCDGTCERREREEKGAAVLLRQKRAESRARPHMRSAAHAPPP